MSEGARIDFNSHFHSLVNYKHKTMIPWAKSTILKIKSMRAANGSYRIKPALLLACSTSTWIQYVKIVLVPSWRSSSSFLFSVELAVMSIIRYVSFAIWNNTNTRRSIDYPNRGHSVNIFINRKRKAIPTNFSPGNKGITFSIDDESVKNQFSFCFACLSHLSSFFVCEPFFSFACISLQRISRSRFFSFLLLQMSDK